MYQCHSKLQRLGGVNGVSFDEYSKESEARGDEEKIRGSKIPIPFVKFLPDAPLKN